jgi:hypothetical protein
MRVESARKEINLTMMVGKVDCDQHNVDGMSSAEGTCFDDGMPLYVNFWFVAVSTCQRFIRSLTSACNPVHPVPS